MESGGGWIVFALGAACVLLWQRSARAEQDVAAHIAAASTMQAQRAAAWARSDAASAERDAALATALAMERERDDALKLVRQARTHLNCLASRMAMLSGDYVRASEDLMRARGELSAKTAELVSLRAQEAASQHARPPAARLDDLDSDGLMLPRSSRRARRRYQQA